MKTISLKQICRAALAVAAMAALGFGFNSPRPATQPALRITAPAIRLADSGQESHGKGGHLMPRPIQPDLPA